MATPEQDVLREMAGLLGAMTEGLLDDAGRRRLTQLVREEPEARRLYVDYRRHLGGYELRPHVGR